MGINPLSPKLIWLGSEKCQSTFTLFIFITCWQQMESQTANSWITRHMKRLESRLPLYFQVNDSILTDSMEWENLHGDFHFWDCSKIHPRGFPHPHLHPHHPRGNHLHVLILRKMPYRSKFNLKHYFLITAFQFLLFIIEYNLHSIIWRNIGTIQP